MAIAMNTLLTERREDGTALITIRPPETAFLHHLPATLAALDKDPEIQVFVIACAEAAFSVGDDTADVDTPSGRRQARRLLAARRAVERSQTVTIGAVSGSALGGAGALMLACDHVVASTRACFGDEIDAEEALRSGLVHRVVAPEQLIDEALAMAEGIAARRMAGAGAR